MKHRYTIEQLQEAVTQSYSMRNVLILLGISPRGGNYKGVLKRIAEHNINTSHFTGQGHNKGKTLKQRTTTEDYLSNKVPISSFRLKKRLITDGIFKHECSTCHLSLWLDNPIPIELDHIDGNNENNSLSNLRLLCPNCHALTETYRGKNQSRTRA